MGDKASEATITEMEDAEEDDPIQAILFFKDPADLGETLQLSLDVLLCIHLCTWYFATNLLPNESL